MNSENEYFQPNFQHLPEWDDLNRFGALQLSMCWFAEIVWACQIKAADWIWLVKSEVITGKLFA